MRANACIFSLGLLTLPLYAAESGVYKCTVAGKTTYQGTPCEQADAQQTLIASARLPGGDTSQTLNAKENADSRLHASTTGDALVAGTSDTRILNLREWGRPKHISRSKGEDGWHEEWTYLSRTNRTTLLRFVNGRLAGVVSPAAGTPAPVTPQVAAIPTAAIPEVAAMEDLPVSETPSSDPRQEGLDPVASR